MMMTLADHVEMDRSRTVGDSGQVRWTSAPARTCLCDLLSFGGVQQKHAALSLRSLQGIACVDYIVFCIIYDEGVALEFC